MNIIDNQLFIYIYRTLIFQNTHFFQAVRRFARMDYLTFPAKEKLFFILPV